MVAALLHDIGKGGLTEHSVAGEPIARADRDPDGLRRPTRSTWSRTLVRWHLLLAETATTRDPDDPATVGRDRPRGSPDRRGARPARGADRGRRPGRRRPKAWSSWRAGLVRDLAAPVLARWRSTAGGAAPPIVEPTSVPVPPEVRRDPACGPPSGGLRPATGRRVTVIVAATGSACWPTSRPTLALQRASVRARPGLDARTTSRVSVWDVADEHLDPAVLRQRFEAIVDGRVRRRPTGCVRADAADARARGRRTARGVRPGHRARGAGRRPAGRRSTWCCAALAALDITVRSAHVDTLGPQAVDVFYLQEAGAGALSESRAAEAAHAVRDALGGD